MCRLRRVNTQWCDLIGTIVEWTALKFTLLDAPGYERCSEAQRRRWWTRFRPRTRDERFVYEVDHFNSVLSKVLHPIGSLQWSVSAVLEDPEVDYYASELYD